MNLEFLGVTPKQGPVLYLSLEDDHQRIKKRSRLMYPEYVNNWKWPEQLLFAYDCPRLDEGWFRGHSRSPWRNEKTVGKAVLHRH